MTTYGMTKDDMYMHIEGIEAEREGLLDLLRLAEAQLAECLSEDNPANVRNNTECALENLREALKLYRKQGE